MYQKKKTKRTIYQSPLRYPGGKNKLAKFIALICRENNIKGHYVEPYAGGAAVALFLLLNNYVSRITINDIDNSIYAFWYSILNDTEKFCELIRRTDIDIENWKKCRKTQRNKEKASLLELGFSTFFLNRTNVSGVIDAGVIGGLDQKGKYKIDCRFNKEELINRIKKIADRREDIELHRLDALDLIDLVEKQAKKSSTIFYFDPPYYLKGESLYFNCYKHDNHKDVSDRIKKIKNARWIVSYDNVKEIKKLYEGFNKIEYSFFHHIWQVREGKEILFFDNNLAIPPIEDPINVNL